MLSKRLTHIHYMYVVFINLGLNHAHAKPQFKAQCYPLCMSCCHLHVSYNNKHCSCQQILRPSCKAPYEAAGEEGDRRKDGKTTWENGLTWKSARQWELPRTERDGESWSTDGLWWPNHPPGLRDRWVSECSCPHVRQHVIGGTNVMFSSITRFSNVLIVFLLQTWWHLGF